MGRALHRPERWDVANDAGGLPTRSATVRSSPADRYQTFCQAHRSRTSPTTTPTSLPIVSSPWWCARSVQRSCRSSTSTRDSPTPPRNEALSYVGLTSGANALALPYVAKFVNGWLVTFVARNLGSASATVVARFTSYDGTKTATLTRIISPGASRFVDPSVEPALLAGTEYSVMLSADQPIAAVRSRRATRVSRRRPTTHAAPVSRSSSMDSRPARRSP